MKALFITAGPLTWASSRLRAFWPAAYLEGVDVVRIGDIAGVDPDDYDALVFQKIFDPVSAETARRRGARVYWDVCDPAWWFSPAGARGILPFLNGVVCSNEPLREDFSAWCADQVPSCTIPDRIELEHYPLRRAHAPADPVRFIWFGLAINRAGLFAGLAPLNRLAANGHRIALTVFDDQPGESWSGENFPIYHARWSLDQENGVLAAHDIAILPPYPGPWGRVKSNNRALTAWACGLPVVDGMDYPEMEDLVACWEHRRAAGTAGYGVLALDYTADKSAAEWEAVLCGS
jgi:hypothetical protein